MLNLLIGPIAEPAGGWLKSKAATKAAETEAKVAMKKAEAKVYETEATSTMLMEQQLTRQMEELEGRVLGNYFRLDPDRLLPALDPGVCQKRFHLPRSPHPTLVCQLSVHLDQRQLRLPDREGRPGRDRE